MVNEASRDTQTAEEVKPAESTAVAVMEKEEKFSIPCSDCGAFLPLSEEKELVCDVCDSIHIIDEQGNVKATGEKREKAKAKKEKKKKEAGGVPNKVPTWAWIAIGVVVVGSVFYFMKRKK